MRKDLLHTVLITRDRNFLLLRNVHDYYVLTERRVQNQLVEKEKKREDNRGIQNREWLVDPPNETISKLKYDTCKFTTAAADLGGTFRDRYHVYCCPQLGAGRVALRRIPCPCEECNSTIRRDWKVGTPVEEQPRFASVPNCQYNKLFGGRNEWNIITLIPVPSDDNDDIDAAKEEVLVSLSSTISEGIVEGHYGAVVTEDPKAPDGYWIVEWTSIPYTDQATGNLVADALYLNTVDYAPKWWTRSVQETKVKINNVVLADVKMIEIKKKEPNKNMPPTSCNVKACLRIKALKIDDYDDNHIFEEIPRRDLLEHEPRILANAEAEEVREDDDGI